MTTPASPAPRASAGTPARASGWLGLTPEGHASARVLARAHLRALARSLALSLVLSLGLGLTLGGWPRAAHAQTSAGSPAAAATLPELASELPTARLQGTGRLRFFGMHIYDARLWVGEGFKPEQFGQQALALELIYGRSLVGSLIAERSLKEMKRVAEVPDERGERWLAQMTQLFPDVKEGDRITGVYKPGEAARFYVNSRFKGEVRDADFARAFFGIWLSPRTSEPALRESLIKAGGGAGAR